MQFSRFCADFDSRDRDNSRLSEGGERGKQVGGGRGRFDVRNMSLKPVSFVMRFKRFHA